MKYFTCLLTLAFSLCPVLADETNLGAESNKTNADLMEKSPAAQDEGKIKGKRTQTVPEFPEPILKPGPYHEPRGAAVDAFPDRYMKALCAQLYKNWKPIDTCAQTRFKLHFLIEKDGSFRDIRLVKPSDDPQANNACIEAATKTSKFQSKVPEVVHEVDVVLDRSLKH